jgi:hypothetical protein
MGMRDKARLGSIICRMSVHSDALPEVSCIPIAGSQCRVTENTIMSIMATQ